MQFSDLTKGFAGLALGCCLIYGARPVLAGDLPSDSELKASPLPTAQQSIVPDNVESQLRTPLGHHEAVMMSMLGKIHLDEAQVTKIKMIETQFMASTPSGQLPPHAVMQNHINTLLKVLTPEQRENLRLEIIKVLHATQIKPSPAPITTNTQMDNQ